MMVTRIMKMMMIMRRIMMIVMIVMMLQGNCYKREHDGNTLYNSYYQVKVKLILSCDL